MVEVKGYTVIGDRGSQQDAFQCAPLNGLWLAAVCDGMGGMQGGELASKEAIAHIFDNAFALSQMEEDMYKVWMRDVLEQADQRVAALKSPDGVPLRAGTTAVMVIVKENKVYWASVGDSAIYYFNGTTHQLYQVNQMHNYTLKLKEMYEKGEITHEEAMIQLNTGRADALVSFLGVGGLPMCDVGSMPIPLNPDDIMILASDGVYKSLTKNQIIAILEEAGGNAALMSERLCEEAWRLAEKKQDNTTVISVKMQ